MRNFSLKDRILSGEPESYASAGILVVVLFPIAYMIHWMYALAAYRESLQGQPHVGACGMSSLGFMMMFVLVGPLCGVCGAIGAAAGLILAAMIRTLR